MAQTISVEIYQLLEEKLGKEEARKVASAIELGLEVIEKKAETSAFQKKLEIKDELSKELITKAEFYSEIKRLEDKMTTKEDMFHLDRKFTIMFIVLFFTIIFLNQNALEFLAKIFGLLK
jgi:hypothetical protein